MFDEIVTFKTVENLRPKKLNNDEIFGFYGHFKQLKIDQQRFEYKLKFK